MLFCIQCERAANYIVNFKHNSCYLYSLTKEKWIEGPQFPGRIEGPVTVPFDNTFLSIGGYIDGSKSTHIYQFDPENLKWIKRSEELSVPRYPTRVFAFD